MGDSMTNFGTYPTTIIDRYEFQLKSLLGSGWTVYNRGKSGTKTSDMLSRFNTDVIAPGNANVVIIWGGLNDVRWDVAPIPTIQDTKDNLQSMYNLAHNAGIKVIAIGLTPFKGCNNWTGSAYGETFLNRCAQINNWIQNEATNIDYKIMPYSLLEDTENSDTLKAIYDYGDHLHLSQLGCRYIGTLIHDIAKAEFGELKGPIGIFYPVPNNLPPA